ncbi:hypothetical protein C8R43DRAFT_1010758 [Mycena crocata]|nr:hypothetical protein C8R43DRAFT_1010758 [Mycena crocata]
MPYPHTRARSSPARRTPRAAHPETPAHPPCLVRARLPKCVRVDGNAQLGVRIVLRRPVTSRQVAIPPGYLPRPCASSRRVPRLWRVPTWRSRAGTGLVRSCPQVGTYGGPSPLRSPLVPTRSAQIPLTRWNSALPPSFASSRGCVRILRVESRPAFNRTGARRSA